MRESWIRKNREMPFKLYKPNGTEIVPVLLDKEAEDEFIDKWEIMKDIIMDTYTLDLCYGVFIHIENMLDGYGLEGTRDKVKEILKIYSDVK